MTIAYRFYDPGRDYAAVEALWQEVLGATYPVSRRVLWPRIAGRNTLEAGDAWVVLNGEQLAGFGVAEIDRAVLVPPTRPCVQALIVHPDFQRRGIGTELLKRIEQRASSLGYKEIAPGAGPWRFWTGVPNDLPGARAFFTRHGYVRNNETVDLYGSLENYSPDPQAAALLKSLGITAGPVTDTNFGSVYAFMCREAPGWRGSMMMMMEAGDKDNVLVLYRGTEEIACIQTYTPQSRYRGPNVVWDARYGERMGGFGAVLVAKAWRGKGLGVALCHQAATHIKNRGGSGCYIDWTVTKLLDLVYSKVGTSVCMTYGMYSKKF